MWKQSRSSSLKVLRPSPDVLREMQSEGMIEAFCNKYRKRLFRYFDRTGAALDLIDTTFAGGLPHVPKLSKELLDWFSIGTNNRWQKLASAAWRASGARTCIYGSMQPEINSGCFLTNEIHRFLASPWCWLLHSLCFNTNTHTSIGREENRPAWWRTRLAP